MHPGGPDPRIPKLLHFVWVGGAPLPGRFRDNIRSWQRHNPDYAVMKWDESNIDSSNPFIQEAHRQKAWAKLSDLVRLMAVAQHGGIYLDTDVEACRSFDDLLACECFFGFQSLREEDDPVCNAVFGALPGHWFIRRLIDAVPTVSAAQDLNEVGTGPEVVSALLRHHGLPSRRDRRVQAAGVDVFPPTVFYPYHWTEDFSRSHVKPDTMTIHHWDMSWHHAQSSSALRVLQRLVKAYPKVYRPLRRLYRAIR